MKKRSGSAILIVIGIMIVLAIIATFTLSNKSRRAMFTDFMSNEAKIESVCEAVLEYSGHYIRSNANKENSNIYKLLRSKWQHGAYPILEPVDENKSTISHNKFSEVTNELIANMTGDDKLFSQIEIEDVKLEVIHAEAFDEPGYDVAGVTIQPTYKTNETPSHFPSLSSVNMDWHLPFMYPPKGSEGKWNDLSQSTNIPFLGESYAYETPYFDIKLNRDLIASAFVPEELAVALLLKAANSDIDSKSAFKFAIKLSEATSEALNQMTSAAETTIAQADQSKQEYEAYEEALREIERRRAAGEEIDDDDIPEAPTGYNQQDWEEKQDLKKYIDENSSDDSLAKQVNEGIEKFNKPVNGVSIDLSKRTIDLEYMMVKNVRALNSLEKLTPKEFQKKLMDSNSNPIYRDLEINNDLNINECIEKGGILRISCTVKGTLNQSNKPPIERTLTADLPFKTSDIAPMAPRHTFFIANSEKIDFADIVSRKRIDLNRAGDPLSQRSTGVLDECIMVSNLNHSNLTPSQIISRKYMVSDSTLGEGKESKMLSYSAVNDITPSAGRIRILGEVEPVNYYCGGLAEGIDQTEIPALALSSKPNPNDDKLCLKATFGMTDKKQSSSGDMKKITKISFPMISKVNVPFKLVSPAGFEGLAKVFESIDTVVSDLYTAPTLLYGKAHLGFPMGDYIEGDVGAKVSVVQILLHAELTLGIDVVAFKPKISYPDKWDSEFKIWYKIENEDKYTYDPNNAKIAFGLPNVSSYDKKHTKWANLDNYATMPENCYSPMQYEKKASRYYDKIEDFKSDCKLDVKEGGLKKGAAICCDGVIYINDTTALDLSNHTFEGNGLIVADSISIQGNGIKIKGDDSSLGVIARNGSLTILNCTTEGSYFSNSSPTLTDCTIIGNLVTNSFDRGKTKGLINIIYNTDHIVPAGDEGKGKKGDYDKTQRFRRDNLKRYFVSIADDWSKSNYVSKSSN